MEHFDIIVVGLGAMGASCLYQLAKKGASERILGIDQYEPPHDKGSSHGGSRVTRLATAEGSTYVPLAMRTLELVKSFENQVGRRFYHPDGLVIAPGDEAFLDNTLSIATTHAIEHARLSEAALSERLPQLKLIEGCIAYAEPTMGTLEPEALIEYQLAEARTLGAIVKTSERVDFALKRLSCGSYAVKTDKDKYQAKRVIVTAGPWARDFISSKRRGELSVMRATQFYFNVDDHYKERYLSGNFPTLVRVLSSDLAMCLIPDLDGSGSVKLSPWPFHVDPNKSESPDHITPVTQDESASAYATFIEPFFEGITAKCVSSNTCLYTAAPREDFIIDRMGEGLLFVSACSGHGFKHSLAIGESLAECVLGLVPHFDLLKIFGGFF